MVVVVMVMVVVVGKTHGGGYERGAYGDDGVRSMMPGDRHGDAQMPGTFWQCWTVVRVDASGRPRVKGRSGRQAGH